MWKAILFPIFIFGISIDAFAAETLTFPACGFDAAVTQETYSGVIQLTVSGSVITVPPGGHDGFYGVDGDGNTVSPNPASFRLARASESVCTCSVECSNNFPVSDFLVGDYPDPSPEHIYIVLIDIGDPPDQLAFGIRDCGCFDNSGTLTVTVEQVPLDSDSDGVIDPDEFPACLDTSPGAIVNTLGCSVDQICPCSAPLGRVQWRNHDEYVNCVKQSTREFLDLGLLSKEERREAEQSARASECGR